MKRFNIDFLNNVSKIQNKTYVNVSETIGEYIFFLSEKSDFRFHLRVEDEEYNNITRIKLAVYTKSDIIELTVSMVIPYDDPEFEPKVTNCFDKFIQILKIFEI